MPLRSEGETLGVIAVARNPTQSPFDTTYLDLVSDFADHAAVALTLATARDRTQELMILADRDRIARDMHDHVIQRIFAVGLTLQGIAGRVRSQEISERVTNCIDDLQSVIDDMRRTIFNLQHSADAPGAFSQRLQEAIGRLTESQDIATAVRIQVP